MFLSKTHIIFTGEKYLTMHRQIIATITTIELLYENTTRVHVSARLDNNNRTK